MGQQENLFIDCFYKRYPGRVKITKSVAGS